jgi:hypothetical protein
MTREKTSVPHKAEARPFTAHPFNVNSIPDKVKKQNGSIPFNPTSIKEHFYERKVHSLDGPGGRYEGL